MTDNIKPIVTRRQTLAVLTGAAGAALPLGAAEAQSAAPRRLLADANVCVLMPQQIEGPFCFDPKLVRTDITESRPGVPMDLLFQIVAAADCAPIKGARVDVWHADASGFYSGYRGQGDAGAEKSTVGEHFLRGTQFADSDGLVKFSTIYPGWYRGRTAHIHGKVFLGDDTVLTVQFYFPDALSEYIYTSVPPYNARAHQRDTVNTTDQVLLDSDEEHRSFLNVKEAPDRYEASLIIGVDRTAKAETGRGAMPPGGPPPGGPPPGGPPPGGPPGSEGGPQPPARPKGPLVPGIAKAQ